MNTMDSKNDEFGNNFITLTDDNGEKFELEHLDTLEKDGNTYMAFIPAEMSISDEYELMILKVELEEGTGDELLATIDDEDELNEVFEIFQERLENAFEEGEDEDDEEAELSREGY